MIFFVIASVGVYGYLGPFWTFPSVFLTDDARAGGIDLINSVGNLGGFLGPYMVGYLSNTDPKIGYLYGLLFLVVCLLISSGFVLLVRKTSARVVVSAAD
jgi:MFS transporter, ACS family, tartrate transporter